MQLEFQLFSRWWQLKYFWNFQPSLGKINILTNWYFSDELKAPTGFVFVQILKIKIDSRYAMPCESSFILEARIYVVFFWIFEVLHSHTLFTFIVKNGKLD